MYMYVGNESTANIYQDTKEYNTYMKCAFTSLCFDLISYLCLCYL